MTTRRRNQIEALRNRLNDAGEPRGYYAESADDTVPANGSAWNRKRIRIRNRCNAILATR